MMLAMSAETFQTVTLILLALILVLILFGLRGRA